jgi:ribosome-binding protein aMBF1 (putative translation factor)
MKESVVVAKSQTITGTQIRAARGFLAWDRRDLAKKSAVTLYTIERIETGAEMTGAAMTKGLAAIKATLEAEGIEFTTNAGALGVLLHPKKGK